MKVGLFIPCYINALYPEVGEASYKLLTQLGVEVDYPLDQTCCGQPMANAGYERDAKALAERMEALFAKYDYVVGPSASCVVFVKEGYPRLLNDYREHACIDSRIWEICEFVHDVVKPTSLPARFPHKVSIHNSCHGLRKLGLGSPSELNLPYHSKLRDLLTMVEGIEIAEPSRIDECCGFGGMFSVEENAVSTCMGRDKVRDHLSTGAEYITGADSSCLMHMQGIIDHDKLPIRTLHIVQILTKRDKMMHEVPEWEALREASSQIKRHTLSHLAHYLEEFERNATANGIVVHWAADADEMNRTVWELISAHGGKNLIKSKSMLSEECGLTPYLLQRGVDAVESDLGERIMQLLHEPPSHIVLPAIAVRREEVGALFEKVWHTEPGNSDPTYLTHQARIHLRSKFLGADIAMTGVNFAVAEAGAFAVCTNEGNADLGTSFPDLHIAIMGLEKVIPDYRALAVFTRLLARSATGQPVTAYTSLYRRPAPGKQIHVIIVDNGRTESLANAAHRNMLKCLRCGACMNTCPVYRRSGGYSYSYFIPGPLGINLGMLRSPERYGGNVSGCSLCYSCSDVCPAKIDLGEQIYAWRQEMGEKNLIDWHKKFMVKGMDFAMGGPGRFYAAVGAARIAEYLPRFVLNNKLNPWYAYGRDIPHFARSTFNARWKAGKVKSEKPTER